MASSSDAVAQPVVAPPSREQVVDRLQDELLELKVGLIRMQRKLAATQDHGAPLDVPQMASSCEHRLAEIALCLELLESLK